MKKLFFLTFAIFFLFLPFFVFGQELNYPTIPGVTTPHPGISLEEFGRYIYRFSLIIGAVIAFAVFVYGGFLYLTSVGNPTKMSEAKDRMLSAILGLLILFGSYIILSTLDPSLTIFQAGEVSMPPAPQTQRVDIEQQMPKSCQYIPERKNSSIVTIKSQSDALADFLGNQTRDMIWFTDGPFGARAFLDTLENTKDIDCSMGQTHCRPDTDSTDCLVIDCQWKNNPEKRVLNKIKETEEGLEKIKEILKKLLESEKAKDLKGTLNQLEGCYLDAPTDVYINSQAEQRGILANLGLASQDPLDFHCCDRIAFPAPRVQGACYFVPVASVAKRVLEIRNELVFLAGYMIEKYSKLMNYGTNMAHLLSQCDIKECQAGNCSGSNFDLGLTCPPGDDCTAPAGGDDICQDGVLDDLEKEYEKAKKIVEEELIINGVGLGTKLLWLQGDLWSSKNVLGNSRNALDSWLNSSFAGMNPDNSILLSCFDAKSLGLKEDLTILGIGLGEMKIQCKDIRNPVTGTLVQTRHGLDYYICPTD